jgi:hypothetical protein
MQEPLMFVVENSGFLHRILSDVSWNCRISNLKWFVQNAQQANKAETSDFRLGELVCTIHSNGCKNLGSKVYSLYGMLLPQHLLGVNYSKSTGDAFFGAEKLIVNEW